MPERRGEVRIDDRVVFSGAEYGVVALSGSLVRLLADSGDAVVVAMAYLAGAPDFAVVGAGPRTRLVPSGLLDALPAKAAEAARELERHLTEVDYIIVPPDATPKNVAIEIAAFLGLPYSSHENPHFITHSVASVLRKVGCSMVLVDEVTGWTFAPAREPPRPTS